MLQRLYVDNYKCLVNFSIEFDELSLLLGRNGCGKSTIFEVLMRIQQFLSGNSRVRDCFPPQSLTRWQTRGTQLFELETRSSSGLFKYRLALEHDDERKKVKVETEELHLDRRLLFRFHQGTVQLQRDDDSEGPTYPFDWTQSGLASVFERKEYSHLAWFRNHVRRYVIVALKPDQMQCDTPTESEELSANGNNFASWYRYLVQEHPTRMSDSLGKLREVIDGLHEIRLRQAGSENRILEVGLSHDGVNKAIYYRFDELSDGQRALVALYTMIAAGAAAGYTLFLDEPDNYVALAELEPWLTELGDTCGEGLHQAVLISHHPELIDHLGKDSGVWLRREGNGPVRIGDAPELPPNTLKLSEIVARGWEDGET